MSSEQPRRARETGGSGKSPIGSTAAIIIAVVAVVGGFLILRQINDDDDGGGTGTIDTPGIITTGTAAAPTDTGAVVTTLLGETTMPATTVPAPPTTPAPATTGATVIVANASTVDGAAGRFTTALKGAGFTTAEATNNSGPDFPVSVVYYASGDSAAQAVATYLSSLLGNIAVEPMPTPPPVQGGALDPGVTVLLMLGSDKADKTLAEAGAPATTTIPAGGTATTAAP